MRTQRPDARPWIGLILTAAALACPWLPAPGPRILAAADRNWATPAAAATRWTGTGSCSALDCHGGVAGLGATGLKGSEYTAWAMRDPHAKAYEALLTPRARRMLARYRGMPDAAEARPGDEVLCLSCHVHQEYNPSLVEDDRLLNFEATTKADGVGCESCHGAAGGWLAQHGSAAWKGLSLSGQLSDARKQREFGMVATKDLVERGRRCVACHVGDGRADVNHDLIAAGHPRLEFEYASQMARYPKHWLVEDDKRRDPSYEARAWAVGRALSAQAALSLLSWRAEASKARGDGLASGAHALATPPAWPEFSEYECASCHHDLSNPATRPGQNAGRGPLAWGSWFAPSTRFLAGVVGQDVPWLGSLEREMRRPSPSPAAAADLARQGVVRLEALIETLRAMPLEPGDASRLIGAMMASGGDIAPISRDRAEATALGLRAMARRLVDDDPRRAETLFIRELSGYLDVFRAPGSREGLTDDQARELARRWATLRATPLGSSD
ncbi:multiheme c-type cytochrome [Isosphaeraceae bacterium EP7]